ncbi:hypothetical protein CC78DRAFT_529793 [Lojkania enalia]|uniref:Uncharacterized protein n=1 Tax=Lojkania enalia TaxID=147567 RepID=A0A9P4KI80_9PLEO|nr:hypothetical protein CC78DRAFT_529793 [Didymosphaeria enalia]
MPYSPTTSPLRTHPADTQHPPHPSHAHTRKKIPILRSPFFLSLPNIITRNLHTDNLPMP